MYARPVRGQPYGAQVRALNAPQMGVRPRPVPVPPGAPTITSVAPGDASAVVAFDPPVGDEGIIEYEAVEEAM